MNLTSKTAQRIGSTKHVVRSVGGAGIIYCAALIAIFVGELLISRKVDAEEFGAYQLVRNSIPLLTGIGLLGYDQILVREIARGRLPNPRIAAAQYRVVGVSVAMSAALALYFVTYLEFSASVLVCLPVATYCISHGIMVGSVMRGLGFVSRSALVYQGYRLLAGTALILLALGGTTRSFPLFIVLAVAATPPMIAAVVWQRRSLQGEKISPAQHRVMRGLGLAFSLSAITLAATDWLDQFLVSNSRLGLSGNGEYAVAKLLTVYPLLSIASVAGFVGLGEVARRSSLVTQGAFLRWLLLGSCVCVLFSALIVLAANTLGRGIFDLRVSTSTIILLAVAGGLRLLYVLPSAVLGAVGTSREIVVFGAMGLGALTVQFAVSTAGFNQVSLVSVALGLLASVLVRTIAGIVMCHRVLRVRR